MDDNFNTIQIFQNVSEVTNGVIACHKEQLHIVKNIYLVEHWANRCVYSKIKANSNVKKHLKIHHHRLYPTTQGHRHKKQMHLTYEKYTLHNMTCKNIPSAR